MIEKGLLLADGLPVVNSEEMDHLIKLVIVSSELASRLDKGDRRCIGTERVGPY
jgi:hypothetical protein